MGKSVPHFSPEWLEDYNKRLAKKPATEVKQPGIDVMRPYKAKAVKPVPIKVKAGKQSKTEEKYNREILGGVGRFEAVALHLPGGGRYTPDFMTVDDGVVTFHEVKGSYRLGSQGRAYTAFHDAAAFYPMWRFVWAHWTGKAWDIKTLPEIREDLTGN